MAATGPVALIEPQMAVNNFYDKHASRVTDKYREQEVHLKRLNRIQQDLQNNKANFAATFVSSSRNSSRRKNRPPSSRSINTLNAIDEKNERLKIKLAKQKE